MKRFLAALCALHVAVLAEPPQPASTTSPTADQGAPGLLGRYYQLDSTLSDFPEIPKDKKPDLERIDKQIKFPSTQEAWAGTLFVDNFYVRWTGRLRVPKAGVYTFFLDSDDGSRLSLDGKQVVANEGTHDMVEVSAKLELTAGEHDLVFEYFESEIDSGCIFSWQGPGLAKQVVPPEAFSHKLAGTPAPASKPTK